MVCKPDKPAVTRLGATDDTQNAGDPFTFAKKFVFIGEVVAPKINSNKTPTLEIPT